MSSSKPRSPQIHKIVFVITKPRIPHSALPTRCSIGERASVEGPDAVRPVGAEPEDIKKLKKDADYLAEGIPCRDHHGTVP